MSVGAGQFRTQKHQKGVQMDGNGIWSLVYTAQIHNIWLVTKQNLITL